MSQDTLATLVNSLEIPNEYASSKSASPPDIVSRLNAWKDSASRVLRDLCVLLKETHLSIPEQADVIAATASFDGEDPWITPQAHSLASEILADFLEPDVPLMTHLLTHKVKPLFQSNPHPSLNPSTGRKLDRPAGGPMATQDFYESQAWKNHSGAKNLVFWCLRHIKSQDYDRLWFLVIPPVMTFLDDYQVPYKLKGVEMVLELLQHVPREILKRTGVDGLILTSLNTCLAQLDDPKSPSLIRAAVSASLSLTLLTTTSGSAEQFDQLCALLGERVIGTIWLYSSDKPGVILASVDALPPLVDSLGLGSTRYLKALIPQLVHPLLPVAFKSIPVKLQISSLQALTSVINQCSYRMPYWKGTILDGISRCWVDAVENQSAYINGADRDELKRHLRSSCQALANACSSIIENEFRRLLATDYAIFQDLVLGIS